MHNQSKSIWSAATSSPKFPAFRRNIKTDVLIIGGGMAGVLCAYFLKQADIDYVLVDGRKIGGGITKNTTAKITSQHGLIYNQLIKNAGCEKAEMYLKSNQLAITEFAKLAEKFPCDFERKSAFVYSHNDRRAIECEVQAVSHIGGSELKANFVVRIPLPFKIAGAVEFENQAQFNPLKFLYGISENLNIYEDTFIRELRGNNTAITANNHRIKADKIIVATHFPMLNKHGSYYLKMYQHRSYVIALENAPNVNGMYLEEVTDGLSFRNYGDLLLISGGDHRTGQGGSNWQIVREVARRKFPNAVEKYSWATQDCMTLDGIPYIGKYSVNTPDLYVTTGFNKWGMTGSMVGAMILTDMVQGRQNQYSRVYSPQRSIAKALINTRSRSSVSYSD